MGRNDLGFTAQQRGWSRTLGSRVTGSQGGGSSAGCCLHGKLACGGPVHRQTAIGHQHQVSNIHSAYTLDKLKPAVHAAICDISHIIVL